jgi:hypothetical protein
MASQSAPLAESARQRFASLSGILRQLLEMLLHQGFEIRQRLAIHTTRSEFGEA